MSNPKDKEISDLIIENEQLEGRIEELEALARNYKESWDGAALDAEGLKLRAEAAEAALERECIWKPPSDWEFDCWQGGCGAAWEFTVDGPVENNMRFCPECGGKVRIADELSSALKEGE